MKNYDVYGLRDPFPATEGASNEYAVTLRLHVGVFKDGTLIGEAVASQDFTLTVTHETATATVGFTASAFVE